MRTLKRNKQKLYYCLYAGKAPIIDEYGNETSEYIVTYQNPDEMYASVSPAAGYTQANLFGNLTNYDKVIVTSWTDCPIDENTVLFLDKEPEFTSVTTNSVSLRRHTSLCPLIAHLMLHTKLLRVMQR